MTQKLPMICLVRHGETAWTVEGRHTGRADIPLTARGEREAADLGPKLHAWNFAHVLTSPLQRAQRTAELAGYGAHIEADADLMEWDCGEYEGRRTVDIRAERPGWRMFVDGCPGGESLEAVGARVDRAIASMRARSGDILLFAHRDLLRVFVARWIGLVAREGRRFYLDTLSVSVLGYDHDLDEPMIRLLNDRAMP